MSLAIRIGRALRDVAEHGGDALAALEATCGAQRLFSGKVVDVERRTTAGFARGTLTVEGLDADAGVTATVDFQNENLIVRAEDVVLAAVPDLITLIDADTGRPLTTETTRYGVRVHVVGAPASEVWWRPEALPLVAPRAFGYDLEPQRLGGPAVTLRLGIDVGGTNTDAVLVTHRRDGGRLRQAPDHRGRRRRRARGHRSRPGGAVRRGRRASRCSAPPSARTRSSSAATCGASACCASAPPPPPPCRRWPGGRRTWSRWCSPATASCAAASTTTAG